jgi:hypothetical protein
MIAHEVADAIPYEKNPVRRVCYGRETLRRRLDRPDTNSTSRRWASCGIAAAQTISPCRSVAFMPPLKC